MVPTGDLRSSALQTDKVKLTWRDRFPAYVTNLVSIVFMVSSGRLAGEALWEPTGALVGRRGCRTVHHHHP